MENRRKANAAQRPSNSQLDKNSERGQPPEQYLAAKRQEAVEKVMAAVTKWLDARLEIASYVYDTSEASGGSCINNSDQTSGNGKSGRSSTGRAKRQFNDDDDNTNKNNSSGGDGNGQDRGGNKRAKKDTERERLLACPFFKHDPAKHCKHRSCTGPGWPSIHRLKEHLYRIHRLSKHTCPRCTEPFDDTKELENHLRSDVACEKRELIPTQGIDDSQEKKLRERKKAGTSMTEEDRWNEIYLILFPKASKKALPSPYYESIDSSAFATSAAQFRKMKKHIQKELPKQVRKRVERKFSAVEADVLDSLGDIVRDELYQLFNGTPLRSPAASPPDSPKVTPASPIPKAACASEDFFDFSRILDLPTPFLGDLGEFDFGAFNEDQFPDKGSDSGYASASTTRDAILGVNNVELLGQERRSPF